jgi:hypothetical protein
MYGIPDEDYDAFAAADRLKLRVAELEGLLREAYVKIVDIRCQTAPYNYGVNLTRRIHQAGVRITK